MLEETGKKIGLETNSEKTKIMELIESREDPHEMEDLNYEKVSDLFRNNAKYNEYLVKGIKYPNK